jgi:hypothetical protein
VKNLVSNAVKYSPAARVQVAARQAPRAVEITVEDEGPASPRPIAPASSSRTTARPPARGRLAAPGWAAVVKSLVDAHGRTIRADNVTPPPHSDDARSRRFDTLRRARVVLPYPVATRSRSAWPTPSKRLTTAQIVEMRDEASVRAAIRHVVIENIAAEEQLDTDARKLLLEHAKMIKDSAADYRQLLGKVKEKLARERGFIL